MNFQSLDQAQALTLEREKKAKLAMRKKMMMRGFKVIILQRDDDIHPNMHTKYASCNMFLR
jgi:hypothetical protein